MSGASNVIMLVIASRLFGAANPEITAAMQNKHRPNSIPERRYRNLPLQKLHISQRINENIRTDDTDKV